MRIELSINNRLKIIRIRWRNMIWRKNVSRTNLVDQSRAICSVIPNVLCNIFLKSISFAPTPDVPLHIYDAFYFQSLNAPFSSMALIIQ